jgi:hypothetical protein
MSRLCPTCARQAKEHRLNRDDCKGFDCRRCPWPPCDCTHTGRCEYGWITLDEPDDEGSLHMVTRCPQCAKSRQRVENEAESKRLAGSKSP